MPPSYLTEQHLEDVHQLFNKGDWRSLLEIHRNGGEEERILLWPTPDEQDLQFIVETIRTRNKQSIVSIGCGTGLLEWLIQQATGFQVYGVEVDRRYWSQAKSRNKVFLEAVYPEDEQFQQITTSPTSAIMFCYFNNRNAFNSYLENYKGHCIIIIAPHQAGRHTEPGPFDSSLVESGWTLLTSKEIRNTKDFIAIYVK